MREGCVINVRKTSVVLGVESSLASRHQSSRGPESVSWVIAGVQMYRIVSVRVK